MSAVCSRNASDCRLASSSSMTWTMTASDGIADLLVVVRFDLLFDLLLGHCGQRQREHRAAARVRARRDGPAVRLDDRARDRQTDSHALRLAGDERLEQLR